MKRIPFFNMMFCLLLLLFSAQIASAQGVVKQVRINNYWHSIVDGGDEGENTLGWGDVHRYYYDGFREHAMYMSKAVYLGAKNFTDATGTVLPSKVSGHGQWTADMTLIWIPVPDDIGFTIHRYRRFVPEITVDDNILAEPFPFNFSDHSPEEASAIPGNAEIFVESFINTELGISIHQKVVAYSQKNHDSYIIYDFTFTNTGNVDGDAEIELAPQTLEDVYYVRQIRPHENGARLRWVSKTGELPGEDLRILYQYPARLRAVEWDDLGGVNSTTGMIEQPYFSAEAILFASDPNNTSVNSMDQPSMTGVQDVDLTLVTENSNNLTPQQQTDLYRLMGEGFSFLSFDGIPDNPDARPGHHSPRFDDRGFKYPDDAPWWGFALAQVWACGPYTLEPDESFRIVFATMAGSISPETAFEVGKAWKNGNAQWGDMTPGGSTDILPPHYQDFPELYEADINSPTAINNWAKDNWVMSGRDSLFNTAAAAQFAFDNNYMIPEPPVAPSIEVKSLPDGIRISWGNEADAVSDLAGFRVYRAIGADFAHVPEDETELIGAFTMIFETTDTNVHEFTDTSAQGRISYFYYVAAFDDGSQNGTDFHGNQESLESGRYYNQTPQGASLLSQPAANLDNVRIVPNPFSTAASQLQFTGEPNKIVFFNLPETCKIRIYTEAGDLIKTIDHEGSGDESWGFVPEQQQVSDEGQVIVSGVYIAHIQTPDGKNVVEKFVVVR